MFFSEVTQTRWWAFCANISPSLAPSWWGKRKKKTCAAYWYFLSHVRKKRGSFTLVVWEFINMGKVQPSCSNYRFWGERSSRTLRLPLCWVLIVGVNFCLVWLRVTALRVESTLFCGGEAVSSCKLCEINTEQEVKLIPCPCLVLLPLLSKVSFRKDESSCAKPTAAACFVPE